VGGWTTGLGVDGGRAASDVAGGLFPTGGVDGGRTASDVAGGLFDCGVEGETIHLGSGGKPMGLGSGGSPTNSCAGGDCAFAAQITAASANNAERAVKLNFDIFSSAPYRRQYSPNLSLTAAVTSSRCGAGTTAASPLGQPFGSGLIATFSRYHFN